MMRMQFSFPMRVRCIAGTPDLKLDAGREYLALRIVDGTHLDIDGIGEYFTGRFKPIVRVKAPTRRYWPGMTLKRPVATFLFDAMIEASLC